MALGLLVLCRPTTSGLKALCEEALDTGALFACVYGLLRPRSHNSLLNQDDEVALRLRPALHSRHHYPLPDDFRKSLWDGYSCDHESLQRRQILV